MKGFAVGKPPKARSYVRAESATNRMLYSGGPSARTLLFSGKPPFAKYKSG